MVVTVYQTQTDGWDSLGLLTTLERATVTQAVTATEGDEAFTTLASTTQISSATSASNPLSTSNSTPISAPNTGSSHTSIHVPTSTSTSTPSSTQLSTASIVGIALGSVAGAVLILTCLLFTLGFRIQRAKRRRHITPTEVPDPRVEGIASASIPGRPYGKAELADSEYLQKVERLHEGSKPELEETTAMKSIWRFFPVRSLRISGQRQGPAELAAESVKSGPHELPGEGVLKRSSDEARNARDAT